ncbi:MAG: hypothetical protein C0466_08175 [Candidatus Accumulibacter sp.]|nr:hypothetical protein [Accumulibacter sp.]
MADPTPACLLALPAHPLTPDAFVATAGAAWTADGGLRFSFRLSGDLSGVRLPAPAPAARRDGLWRHTCCEAFVGARGAPAYREFNFSPAGAWAAYAFSAYRQAAGELPAAAPAIRVARDDGRDGEEAASLSLFATVAADCLPPAGEGLDIGLSMVVEAADGTLSYRALRHCAERPDFHRRDSFALLLPFP